MSDEFEGSAERPWKRHYRWETTNKTWRGRAPGFFQSENVVVRNGSMQLWSREEEPPFHFPKKYHSFSTAFVRTKKKRLYGYFEIRCRLMDSKISSAFWLNCNSPDMWTEIDVIEFSTSKKVVRNGYSFANMFNTNMHVHRHAQRDVAPYSQPKAFVYPSDLSHRVVKIGLNWQHDRIEWFLDDRLLRQEPNIHFRQPLHVQLDSETFPHWFGLPDVEGQNNLPNYFEIFYLRTWYRRPNRPPSPSPAVPLQEERTDTRS